MGMVARSVKGKTRNSCQSSRGILHGQNGTPVAIEGMQGAGHGRGSRDEGDLTDALCPVRYSPNSKLSFMVNGDYGRGDRIVQYNDVLSNPVFWTGVAGYVKYAFNSNSALSARYEYYDDHDGFTTGNATGGLHFNEFTTTYERIVAQHIISRFEFRRDMSNDPVFLKGISPVTAQSTLTAGLVYTFDTKGGK